MPRFIRPPGVDPIELHDAPPEVVDRLKRTWPFGVLVIDPPRDGIRAGVVMQCGERELYGCKFQPPDCDRDSAIYLMNMNRGIIAACLGNFQEKGFAGPLLPVSYLKEKPGGQWESGVACFAYPASTDQPKLDHSIDDAGAVEAGQMPAGAMTMVMAFAEVFASTARKLEFPVPRLIGMDVRARMQLGMICFDFLVMGEHLICLKTKPNPEDPVWQLLPQATKLWHLPSVPLAIRPEDLAQARE